MLPTALPSGVPGTGHAFIVSYFTAPTKPCFEAIYWSSLTRKLLMSPPPQRFDVAFGAAYFVRGLLLKRQLTWRCTVLMLQEALLLLLNVQGRLTLDGVRAA